MKTDLAIRTVIVGSKYYPGAIGALTDLRPGTSIILVRDGENPAHDDPDAVAVMFGLQMLGYLPRSVNKGIARRMDRGETVPAMLLSEAIIEKGEVKMSPRILIALDEYPETSS